jgi:hypothetical protein
MIYDRHLLNVGYCLSPIAELLMAGLTDILTSISLERIDFLPSPLTTATLLQELLYLSSCTMSSFYDYCQSHPLDTNIFCCLVTPQKCILRLNTYSTLTLTGRHKNGAVTCSIICTGCFRCNATLNPVLSSQLCLTYMQHIALSLLLQARKKWIHRNISSFIYKCICTHLLRLIFHIRLIQAHTTM